MRYLLGQLALTALLRPGHTHVVLTRRLPIDDDRPMRVFAAAIATLRATFFVGAAVSFAGCGSSTIRVVGVMQQSSEMRPLPNVALGGYQQLHLFVRAAPGQSASKYGSPDCGFAPLEGTEGQDLNNAACVPVETLNTAIGIVRARFRAYGIDVVRESSDPYDYKVEVSVTGEAPRKADRTLAKAVAKLSFTLHDEASGKTLTSSIDPKAAASAFATIVKNCTMRDASWSAFSATSREPMTPDFDVLALSSDVVDNALRCDDLANFFRDARTLFPKAPDAAPAAASPSAAPAASH